MKKRALSLLVLLQLILLVSSCATGPKPKYVFLFIGDGMGKTHVDLARVAYGPLNMDKLPVRGSVSTVNVEQKTTDSAASGTAWACGVKTRNGRLGIDADGNRVESSALAARQHGRQVAILTTVGLNNATPAAFYAHVMGRGESQKIVEQYPEAHFDILAGSGIDGMKAGVRQEDFITGKAYQFTGEAPQGKVAFTDKQIRVIAQDDAPFFEMKSLSQPVFIYSQGTDHLAAYVSQSIRLMKDSKKGFFMMAEGGRIDHGGHGNNVSYMLSELEKFDKAVGVALEFYNEHPEETLIVVSADHHTGGLSLGETIRKEFLFVTPESMKINGAKDSEAEIIAKAAKAGVVLSADEQKQLQMDLKNGKSADRARSVKRTIMRAVDRHAGIRWSTYGHTNDEVYLFAIGCKAEIFAGRQENSDAGAKIKALLSK